MSQMLSIYVPKPDCARFFAWWRGLTGDDPPEDVWTEYRDAMIKMRGDFPDAYDDLEQMVDDAVIDTLSQIN